MAETPTYALRCGHCGRDGTGIALMGEVCVACRMGGYRLVLAETPGSTQAIALGCLCPREQPQGVQGLYWQNAGCPLHDCTPSTQEQDND